MSYMCSGMDLRSAVKRHLDLETVRVTPVEKVTAAAFGTLTAKQTQTTDRNRWRHE